MTYKKKWIQKKLKENPDYYKEQYKKSNKIKQKYSHACYRESRNGIISRLWWQIKRINPETNITKAWIKDKVLLGMCELTGIPFNYSMWAGYRRPLIPSIDRIDSNKKYTKSNCRIILSWLNIAKSDMSDKIFLDLLEKAVYNITMMKKVKV